LNKSLFEKISEDMINRAKESGCFTDTEIESLQLLASNGNLSSESPVRELIEKRSGTNEDSKD
jgi:hypothetical protein